jgi:hypothetical protein
VRNALVKAIHDSGGRIMAGSDTPEWFHAYGFGLHRELQALVQAGLTPWQALEAATRNPAEFLGGARDWGTIAQGMRADLVLTRVSTAPEPPPAPAPTFTPTRLPPVVELGRLPATFAGNVTCPGCAPARYELNLFPDDSFYLRTTPLGRGPVSQDDLGSWILSSDRRVIVLRTAKGTTEMFAIRDGNTLRRLDTTGHEVAAEQPSDLRRAPTFTPKRTLGNPNSSTKCPPAVMPSSPRRWPSALSSPSGAVTNPTTASPSPAAARVRLPGRT